MKTRKTTTGTLKKSGRFHHTCSCGLDALTRSEVVNHMCEGDQKICSHRGGASSEKFPPKAGLGDWVANGLKTIGITPESYAAAKSKVTKPGCSKCGWRQKLLNRLTEAAGLGKGQGQELQSIIAVAHMPSQHVHHCELHKACLPNARVNESSRKSLCEIGYHPCEGCPDKKIA